MIPAQVDGVITMLHRLPLEADTPMPLGADMLNNDVVRRTKIVVAGSQHRRVAGTGGVHRIAILVQDGARLEASSPSVQNYP